MEDLDVIQAFLSGARQAFGPTLHIEGDGLFVAGWWQAAFRISHEAFIVNAEEPREPTTVADDLAAALSAREMQPLGTDFPLIQAVTLTELSLAGVSWTLWAADRALGEAALAARVGDESSFRALTPEDAGQTVDWSAELEGARRIAGLPGSVIVTVGLGQAQVQNLQVGLTECRFESRSFEEIEPEVCGTLSPTLMLIDATGQAGREFIMELRAAACGRFLPVAAVARGTDPPPGADVALDPDLDSRAWAEPIRRLLPQ